MDLRRADKEVKRVNGSAPDGIHTRLKSVECEARGLAQFSRDNPSLATTVELRDWNNSSRILWPQRGSGSLAAAYAQSMIVPTHPGASWGDPAYVADRRAAAEREQRRIGEFYKRATRDEEDRKNREERERWQR